MGVFFGGVQPTPLRASASRASVREAPEAWRQLQALFDDPECQRATLIRT
jgi:hypothetical protein